MRGSQPHSRQSVPCSDRATALLRRRTIEAMKMLISRRTSSKAASAASAIPNDEAGTIGDAVILISDKMTSRNSFRWTGSRSFRALKYRFGPCASKIGIGAYNAEVEICALFATRNSLKLQEVRKVFLPIRNIHARTLKLWSRSEPAAVEIHSTFSSHATDNLHRARGLALVSLPAVSSIGGFRTPAAGVRGSAVRGRHPKPLYGAHRCQIRKTSRM